MLIIIITSRVEMRLIGVWRMLAAALIFVVPVGALAALTPAGTVISNTVTLDYVPPGGIPEKATSNTASFVVEELINVILQWQDASPVSVNSPDIADALTFMLSNTGNGTETFTLTRNNSPSVPDQYDPLNSATAIYFESNGTPGLQTGVGGDTPYVGGVTLNAEQSVLVYVVSDTPAALPIGNTGQVALSAASDTVGAAGAVPGTALVGLGDGGVTAVVGLTQAQASANGIYIVSGLALSVVKTVVVDGGGDAATTTAPGKTLIYTITVTLTGTGIASNLVITDPLPVELTYVPGSITVNAATRTDADDPGTDNAKFSANAVTVNFGNTAAPATHIITFKAVVN